MTVWFVSGAFLWRALPCIFIKRQWIGEFILFGGKFRNWGGNCHMIPILVHFLVFWVIAHVFLLKKHLDFSEAGSFCLSPIPTLNINYLEEGFVVVHVPLINLTSCFFHTSVIYYCQVSRHPVTMFNSLTNEMTHTYKQWNKITRTIVQDHNFISYFFINRCSFTEIHVHTHAAV